MEEAEQLLPEELDLITKTLQAVNDGKLKFVTLRTVRKRVRKTWGIIPVQRKSRTKLSSVKLGGLFEPFVSHNMPAREYSIGLSDDFLKSIKKVDAKLQGRILKALGQISRNPDKLHGDTVKPLSDDMKGLWRYRIGDYRLIYKPEPESNKVTLLSFSARGNIYD